MNWVPKDEQDEEGGEGDMSELYLSSTGQAKTDNTV